MNDDLNLKELSEIYKEATEIGNPSPLAVQPAIDAFPRRHYRTRFRMMYAFAAASAFLVLLLFGSLGLSFDAYPNTPLYPVKRSLEAVRIALAPSQEAELQLRLTFAEERIRELDQVIGDASAEEVALEGYKEQLAQVSEIVSAPHHKAIEQAAYEVVWALADNVEDLTDIAEDAPAQEQAQVAQAVEQTKASLTAVEVKAGKPKATWTQTPSQDDECDKGAYQLVEDEPEENSDSDTATYCDRMQYPGSDGHAVNVHPDAYRDAALLDDDFRQVALGGHGVAPNDFPL